MDLASPFFWTAAAGLAGGFAVGSLLPRGPRGPRNEGRGRGRTAAMGVAASLWASCMTILAACGAFFADFSGISVPGVLICAAGAIAIGTVSYRFPLWAGVPLLTIASILYLVIRLSLQPWLPVDAEKTLGRIRVISVADDSARFEWLSASGESGFASLPEGRITAGLELLQPPRWAFFFPSRLSVSELTVRSTGSGESLIIPSVRAGAGETPGSGNLSAIILSFPGTKRFTLTSAEAAPVLLRSYYIKLSTDPEDPASSVLLIEPFTE